MTEDPANHADPRTALAGQRTSLAAYRTGLAMDRTTLAWIRTTLGMASFGFGMVAFFRTLEEKSPSPVSLRWHQGAIRMGTALVLLGIGSMVLAGLSHWSALRRLRRGESPVLGPWPLSLTVAMLSAIMGLAGIWAIFTY
jgi:putative membrane protein